MKSVLWRVAKLLSYVEDARCPKGNFKCSLQDPAIEHPEPLHSFLYVKGQVSFPYKATGRITGLYI